MSSLSKVQETETNNRVTNSIVFVSSTVQIGGPHILKQVPEGFVEQF